MRHPRWTLISCIAAVLFAAPGVEAAERFYENLLRDGVVAAEQGETERATRLLRLACFGMLEEPPLLARCLTRLALAQADMDDAEAFLATFQRILGVEQRFTAYTQADLSAAERHRFESALQDMVSAETLARSALFAHLVPAPETQEPSAGSAAPVNADGDEPAARPEAASAPVAVEPAPPPADPPWAVTEAIARAREVRSTGDREAVANELESLRPLADAYPKNRDLQILTAELAYRLRRWEESRTYFERGSEIGADQPTLAFYYAVALYETGAAARAAEVLRPTLPQLGRSAFVDGYVEKILGADASR